MENRNLTSTTSIRANSPFAKSVSNWMLGFVAAHTPFCIVLAWLFDSGVANAAAASIAILALPVAIRLLRPDGSRFQASAIALAIAANSALVIHLSKGAAPAHLHVFAGLTVLIAFADPMIVLASAGAILLHHVGMYTTDPTSLFGSGAGYGLLFVYLAFIAMQALPAAALASLLGRYVQKHEATLATLERVSEKLQETSRNHLAFGEEVEATSSAQISAFGKADQALQGATSSMERNREDAQRSRQLTNASEEAAREGREAASLLLSSIQNVDKTNSEVLETIASSHKDLDRIVKLINEIGSKTSVINDIVFQTKLLSFNASVEAARAGEHGRGFAVVAEEIGNLAKMSGDAAKEITKLLDDSVADVKSTIAGTQERVDAISMRGKGALTTGIETAQRCETTLATAAERAAEARALVEKFTDAGNEQFESLTTAVEAVNRLGELARTSQRRAS